MKQKRLDFERQHYYFELQRKDRLSTSVSIPLGILTALFGAATYFFNKIENFSSGVGCLIFGIAVLLMFFALIYATYCLVKSYWAYKYKCIPTSKEIEDYLTELNKYYNTYPDAPGSVEEKYEEFLLNYFIETNEANIRNNDTKSSYLHKVTSTLILALILSAILIIPLQYQNVVAKAKYVLTKINNSKEVNTNEPKYHRSDSGRQTGTPATATPASSKNNSRRPDTTQNHTTN